MTFYLGTHMEGWLSTATMPLFVSHRRLARRRGLPRARVAWALDSGGFTELNLHGRWTVEPREYVAAVRRYVDEVGQLQWASPQDWMCEPVVLAKTGLDVQEHQRLTIENYLNLRALAPELPFIPVLQGWTRDDYLRCWGRYERAGIDLRRERLVGVGSVCRRQATGQIHEIMEALQPLRLHGFGVKMRGFDRYAGLLFSADSMAWSYNARRHAPLTGCRHKSCANCLRWATRWHGQVERRLEHVQLPLLMEAAL